MASEDEPRNPGEGEIQDVEDHEREARRHEDEAPGPADGGPHRAGGLADEADDERLGVMRPPEGGDA